MALNIYAPSNLFSAKQASIYNTANIDFMRYALYRRNFIYERTYSERPSNFLAYNYLAYRYAYGANTYEFAFTDIY